MNKEDVMQGIDVKEVFGRSLIWIA